MTHQEIADQLAALRPKYYELRKAAEAGLDAEKVQLQEQCGRVGHIWTDSQLNAQFKQCAVCHLHVKRNAEPSFMVMGDAVHVQPVRV